MAPKRPPRNDDGDEEGESSRKRAKPSINTKGCSTAASVGSCGSGEVVGYAVARNLRFRTYIAAAHWVEQGCPRLDFLTTLGLQGLADVKWSTSCPSLVREFVANYNLKRNETVVQGRSMNFTAKLIGDKFQLPPEGVVGFKRGAEGNEQVKLFKDGAYQKDLGYRHDMLNDPSLAPVFSLIAEVVQLRVSSGYTSRNLIEVIVQAMQGARVNWAEYMYQNMLKELRRMKHKAHATVVFGAGPLITHILQNSTDEDLLKPDPAAAAAGLVTEGSNVVEEMKVQASNSSSSSLDADTEVEVVPELLLPPVTEPVLAIPIASGECTTTTALEAIDLNSSSCSLLTAVGSSSPFPSSAKKPPLAAAAAAAAAHALHSLPLFPSSKKNNGSSSSSSKDLMPMHLPPIAPSDCSEFSITSPFSKLFYGINPKIKITSLFSEATRTLNELYSEEEVQKRVNQMLNATTGQLNFERMLRERTEEDLKEAKRQRDEFKADLMLAHTRITVLEKGESYLKEANEWLAKAKLELEDDLENYNCMLLEIQEQQPRIKHQCDMVSSSLQTVEANFEEIGRQVEGVRREIARKDELLRKAKEAARNARQQNEQSQQEQMALQQQLEDLQGAVTELRTELAARALPYDETIWGKIQEIARKHTQEEYGKLVETIADLQEQLDQQQQRHEEAEAEAAEDEEELHLPNPVVA